MEARVLRHTSLRSPNPREMTAQCQKNARPKDKRGARVQFISDSRPTPACCMFRLALEVWLQMGRESQMKLGMDVRP